MRLVRKEIQIDRLFFKSHTSSKVIPIKQSKSIREMGSGKNLIDFPAQLRKTFRTTDQYGTQSITDSNFILLINSIRI